MTHDNSGLQFLFILQIIPLFLVDYEKENMEHRVFVESSVLTTS